jgi:hypothetical protein
MGQLVFGMPLLDLLRLYVIPIFVELNFNKPQRAFDSISTLSMCTTKSSSQVTIHILSEVQGSQLWTLFILGLVGRTNGIEKFLGDSTQQSLMMGLVKKQVSRVI